MELLTFSGQSGVFITDEDEGVTLTFLKNGQEMHTATLKNCRKYLISQETRKHYPLPKNWFTLYEGEEVAVIRNGYDFRKVNTKLYH